MIALEDIIKRCKKNDVTAQRLLYERYVNQMCNVCMRYIGNLQEVKDIVHDGFLKVFSNINQYSYKGTFEGWMTRIFINTTLKHLKKTKKHFMDVDDLENSLEATYSSSPDSDNVTNVIQDNYHSIEQSNFTKQEIVEVIQCIPDPYRIVFNLFHIEEFSHNEIASMLNINISTSRIRLFRARDLIREGLVNKATELQKTKLLLL